MTKTRLREMYKETLAKMQEMKVEYGIDELEDRVTDKAKKILIATTEQEAYAAREKALASCSITCIANGMRRTPAWYEKQARACWNRAVMYKRKGDQEAADVQLKYKAKYEKEALRLRGQTQ